MKEFDYPSGVLFDRCSYSEYGHHLSGAWIYAKKNFFSTAPYGKRTGQS